MKDTKTMQEIYLLGGLKFEVLFFCELRENRRLAVVIPPDDRTDKSLVHEPN
jgi:hypothetical protein